MIKLYNSAQWLRGKIAQGKTISEMAAEAKTSEATIRRALERWGLKR